VELDGADFGSLDLSGVNFRGASLWRTSFIGASPEGADLRGSRIMFDLVSVMEEAVIEPASKGLLALRRRKAEESRRAARG
jgi:uncharacterized protein YjbI with pentapeptide repeats